LLLCVALLGITVSNAPSQATEYCHWEYYYELQWVPEWGRWVLVGVPQWVCEDDGRI
jgi:hypothetical protein